MAKITVEIECGSCGGTGLYCGFAEPKDVAVVCAVCGGTGCAKLSYKLFTGRKGRRGVKQVRKSAGTFIATGVGPVGDSVTYQEFLAGKMPGGK